MTQEQALAIMKTGANIFLTGEPGSGKTHTVNSYVRYLRQNGIDVAVTASTGIAATHLGGITIHSWSGVGIKKILSSQDLASLRENRRLVSRAQQTSVLVIDEISMLDAQTLSCVSQAIGALRDSDQPFGGMQVVLVGDFFQLPPVGRENENLQFAFKSWVWMNANLVICYLSEQHRQADREFLSLLSSIRSGDGNASSHPRLMLRKVEVDEKITRLYSHNINVDRENDERLAKLPGQKFEFEMTKRGARPLIESLKKGCLSPERLFLKYGARVMFTKNNLEGGFVNGTTGEVVNFEDNLPVVQIQNGRKIKVPKMSWEINDGLKILASITQFPLRLAWAITVHKSQGMTLDNAVVDLSEAFEYGQGYVAISRVRSFSGLYLLGVNQRALEVNPQIVEIDVFLREKSVRAVDRLSGYSQGQIMEKHKAFVSKFASLKDKKKHNKGDKSTYDETLELIKNSKTIDEIAKLRNLKPGTIISHLEKLRARKKISDNEIIKFIPKQLAGNLLVIHNEFNKMGSEKLSPVYEKLNGKYTYDELRLARICYEFK